MYRQYELHTASGHERVCWLDDVKLKVGQRLTLKKDTNVPPDTVWTVAVVYDKVEEESQWRTWKVGGLR